MSAPASTRCRVRLRGDDVAGDDAHGAVPGELVDDGAHLLDRVQRARLVAVRRVDHEHVDAEVQHGLGLHGRVAVDAQRHGHPQPTLVIHVRAVQRGAQRPFASDGADQTAVLDDGRRGHPPVRQALEDLGQGRRGLDHHQIPGHHVVELGEAVEARRIGLGEDTDGLVPFHDDDDAVGPLVDQRERIPHRARRRERDGRVVDRVAAVEVLDDRLHDVEGDVLRQDGQAAAPGDRLGHAPPRHRRHVGHDHRQARPHPIGRRQVHVHPRRHRREAGDHEHVAVRQVVGRQVVVEEAHGSYLLNRPFDANGGTPGTGSTVGGPGRSRH